MKSQSKVKRKILNESIEKTNEHDAGAVCGESRTHGARRGKSWR